MLRPPPWPGAQAGGAGDLLTGLPLQSHTDGSGWRHEPLRLQAVIAAGRERIAATIGKHTLLEQIPDWQCDVVALGLDRTFWEKATILHAEHHRPVGKPTPDRFSRHYADVAALARHPATERAITDLDTCERVVGWKRLFFGSAWASYETARPGSFRLLLPRRSWTVALPIAWPWDRRSL